MIIFCAFISVLTLSEFAASCAVDYYRKNTDLRKPSQVGPTTNLSVNFLAACGVVFGGMVIAYLSGADMFTFHSGSLTMICFTIVVGSVANVIRVSPAATTQAPREELDWNHRIKLMIVAAVARKLVIGISVILLFGIAFLIAYSIGVL